MCAREDCPKKKKCYRYTATPHGKWQSYWKPEKVGDECDDFIDNKFDNKDRRK